MSFYNFSLTRVRGWPELKHFSKVGSKNSPMTSPWMLVVFHSLICTVLIRLMKNGPCAKLSYAYALDGIKDKMPRRNES